MTTLDRVLQEYPAEFSHLTNKDSKQWSETRERLKRISNGVSFEEGKNILLNFARSSKTIFRLRFNENVFQ